MTKPEPDLSAVPAAKPVVSITLGVDGRIYCHDLTPELLAVLAELCVADPELQARQAAAQQMERVHE
jgi:hypothetical protein